MPLAVAFPTDGTVLDTQTITFWANRDMMQVNSRVSPEKTRFVPAIVIQHDDDQVLPQNTNLTYKPLMTADTCFEYDKKNVSKRVHMAMQAKENEKIYTLCHTLNTLRRTLKTLEKDYADQRKEMSRLKEENRDIKKKLQHYEESEWESLKSVLDSVLSVSES